jgi:hypothetical protein
MPVKMTKQHIFIIENNLQKVGQSFFHLSRLTTVIQDLLNQSCQRFLMSQSERKGSWVSPLKAEDSI